MDDAHETLKRFWVEKTRKLQEETRDKQVNNQKRQDDEARARPQPSEATE